MGGGTLDIFFIFKATRGVRGRLNCGSRSFKVPSKIIFENMNFGYHKLWCLSSAKYGYEMIFHTIPLSFLLRLQSFSRTPKNASFNPLWYSFLRFSYCSLLNSSASFFWELVFLVFFCTCSFFGAFFPQQFWSIQLFFSCQKCSLYSSLVLFRI